MCAHGRTFPIFIKNLRVGKKSHINIRIKDVAERAGVSVGTVDRVIHQRGEVSPETRKTVLEIIDELQYSPNLLASTLASSRRLSLAILIPRASKENSFWSEHLKGIKRAGIELAPFGLELDIFTFSMTDTKDFRVKSDELLKSRPDCLLLAPVFYQESVHFLGRCRKEKIPFAFIDTPIDQFEYISFIGQNSCQSGAVAAKLLSLGNKPNSTYMVFNITLEKDQLQHLSDREKGFRLFFENKGDTSEIITIDIHGQKQDLIKSSLLSFKPYTEKLKGIFVTGSKVHRVAEVLNQLEMSDVRLVGYDLVKENMNYLRKDVIDFLISQQPEEQGYIGINTLFNVLVNKKEVPVLQSMPIDIITRENLDQYPKCQEI